MDRKRLDRAINAACSHLLGLQSESGYWHGGIEGDSTLEADYILLCRWLGRSGHSTAACEAILDRQLESGGWGLHPGGGANVSASVKAYTALRLIGVAPGDSRMQRAARCILELGGAETSNSYTRFYLSLFGLYPRNRVPPIPPEWFLLDADSRFSVYGMSSWSRTILAPLSILDATRAFRPVLNGSGLGEIFRGSRTRRQPFKSLPSGIRRMGILAARDWMLARLERSDGLGAIFPAIVNSIMALDQLGLRSLVEREFANLAKLVRNGNEKFLIEPCHSPVWDTALSICAIGRAKPELGQPEFLALQRASRWLLSKQVRIRGDWAVRNPGMRPGGWAFEFRNDHYPDLDDTAQVLLALGHTGMSDKRGMDWLASMQSPDGGWAAFDITAGASILERLPFADHNAMLDPTCADITGRCLEAICGQAPGQFPTRVRRGVDYLLRTQEEDGAWYGRWGVNYLYGTCYALRGLRAAGLPPSHPSISRARDWLQLVQNSDGGWGESPESYDRPGSRCMTESTPSQTSWALMALMAAGESGADSVKRGVGYLLERQTPEGTWEETASTGCGFPGVFYLRYSMYPRYFPLMALAEVRRGLGQ